MKKLKNLFLLATAALLAVSCSNDGDAVQVTSYPVDGVIRVAPTIAGAKTRAGITTDTFKKFYLFIDNSANTEYTYFAEWVNTDGQWTSQAPDSVPVQPMHPVWQTPSQAVMVSGFSASKYVYNTENFPFTVPRRQTAIPASTLGPSYYAFIAEDQSTEEELSASDFLITDKHSVTPGTDLVNGKLPLTFHHAFTKLILKVNIGSEFNNYKNGTGTNPITDFKVNNVPMFVSYAYMAAVMSSGMVPITVIPYYNASAYVPGSGNNGAVAVYECIFPPSSAISNFGFSMTINGKPFSWKSTSAIEFKGDTEYTFNIYVGKDAVTLGNITATTWGDGGSKNYVIE